MNAASGSVRIGTAGVNAASWTFRGGGVPRGPGVYAMRHIATGRAYVGSTASLGKRFTDHVRELRDGNHRNRLLQAAWNADGAAAFEFVVLEQHSTTADLLAREQRYINALGAHEARGGFNLAPYAGRHLGCPMTERGKELLSIARTGSRASDTVRAQMSEVRRALWQQPEYRARLLAKRAEKRGLKHSPEHCAKASRALAGKKRTPEQCERIGAAKRGIRLSAEHRAKLAATGTGRVQSEETRQRKREAMHRHFERRSLETA